ncbi:hypothetical protein [Anaerobutyricum soehngenii]|uniref:hypothetical protein n=1 Tax=Anaerobutyricum soehngenii TaxID=105843 RepID=UPI001ADDD7B6|nr:hypothetical protein [Anaerobutyricum soehngenii]
MFKMLVRILHTLPSRIGDISFFLFSDYSKSIVWQRGMYQKECVNPLDFNFLCEESIYFSNRTAIFIYPLFELVL